MEMLNLTAKLSLDAEQYEKGLQRTTKQASMFGEVFRANLAGAAVQKSISMAVNGIKKVSSGIIGITKKAISSYANYEQLVGGVETLFGAQGMSIEEYAKSVDKSVDEVKGEYRNLLNAQSEVMKNAEQAYKTAGLSANAYMEQATSTAAALVNSLEGDTKKAADLADVAITDMSDNANKMGTSIDMIQNAYNGFAKGNFTMLDNLKLGYGGTKTEMERLLQKAEEISGIKYDVSSYADIVQAIHVVQDEMGIAGTTAKEGTETISGSLATLKGAWENVLSAIGGGGDFDNAMDALLESIDNVVNNIKPVLEKALPAVGRFITEAAEFIAENLPGLVEDLLPPIIDGVVTIGAAIVKALPKIVSTIWETIKGIISDYANGDVSGIFSGIEGVFSSLLDVLSSIVSGFIDVGKAIGDTLADLFGFNSGTEATQAVLDTLSGVLDTLASAIQAALGWIADHGDLVISLLAGIGTGFAVFEVASTIMAVVNAFKAWKAATEGATIAQKIFNTVMAANPLFLIISIISAVVTALIVLWHTNEDFRNKVIAIWNAIKGFFISAWEAIKAVWDVVVEFFTAIWEGIKAIFSAIGEWFSERFTEARDNAQKAWEGVKGFFGKVWEGIKTVFGTIGGWFADRFREGRENAQAAWEGAQAFFGTVWEGIKGVFGKVGSWFRDRFKQGYENSKKAWAMAKAGFKYIWSNIQTVFDSVGSWFYDKFKNAKDQAVDSWNNAKDAFAKAFAKIKEAWDEFLSTVKDWGSKLWKKIKGQFDNSKSDLSVNIQKTEKTTKITEYKQQGSPSGGTQVTPRAKGGIFTRPTLTLVGEKAGENEAVVPLNGQYMKPFAKEIAYQMGGTGTTNYINVTVSGAENPEEWVNRAVRQLNLITRTA